MKTPKAFMSYSWDDGDHKKWVRDLAARLRQDGVDVTLDQWHVAPGDQLPEFMERAIRDNDFVLIICTSTYKRKSEVRQGGVGYEGDIIASEMFTKQNQRKFIPILRKDDWQAAAPSSLLGKYFIDLRGDVYAEENYWDLLSTLHDKRERPPELGAAPLNPQ